MVALAVVYVTSLSYLPVLVLSPVSVNPAGDTVQAAFLTSPPPAQPGTMDWVEATWATGQEGPPYEALVLTGPGGAFVPSAGVTYYAWLQVSAAPELPALYAGVVEAQ